MNKTNTCNCDCKNGCGSKPDIIEISNKKILIISWQRLITDGDTCPRCGSTENELNKAVIELKEKLGPVGIKVIVEKKEISLEEFKNNPTISNSISFNGQLLEDVINAKTGKSQCCDVCGDEECRTIEYGDKSLEIIPAELIIKAGLKVLE